MLKHKAFIPLLIISMVIAFSGLISLQNYWIKNTKKQQENTFDNKVELALLKAARFIELQNGNINNSPNLLSKKLRKQLLELEHYQREYIINSVANNNPLLLDSLLIEQAENTTTDTLHLNIIPQLNYVDEASFEEDTNATPLASGNDFQPREWEVVKEELIKEIIRDLTATSKKKIDLTIFEHELIENFAIENITLDFSFSVTLENDNLLILEKNTPLREELEKSPYHVNLHTPYGTGIKHIGQLNVFFPNLTAHYDKSSWKLIFISISVLTLVFLTFVYTVVVVYKQKQLSEAKNDFISNMTHELKTPISTIALASEALSDTNISQTESMRISYLKMIREENKRLGALVENVLQSSVIDKGELTLQLEPVDMQELLESVAENINLQMTNKGSLSLLFKAENPIVQGDIIHLTNVIYNLLDNALKYTTASPEITIEVKNNTNQLEINIQDNGIGISKEHQHKIFDKLYRIPTGNVHNVKGFGLGLSYVKAIVEHHKGSIHVTSDLRKGSTFTITLPQENE